MSEVIGTALSAAIKLSELNPELGFTGQTYAEKNKIKGRSNKVDTWWNGLSEKQKLSVGGLAIHFHKMTAGYCWSFKSWDELGNGQKKRIKFVFNKRNDKAQAFYLPGMFGL